MVLHLLPGQLKILLASKVILLLNFAFLQALFRHEAIPALNPIYRFLF